MATLALKDRFRRSRFLSGEAPVPEPVILTHRRIFILPTLRGLGFCVLATLVFFIAFVYNNNLVYLLSFLLFSVFFITMVHSFKSLSGLIVREGNAKPVFVGESAAFTIYIDNPTAFPRPQIKIAGQHHDILALEPYAGRRCSIYRLAQKRGWNDLGTVTLYSTFPLGLFRAWSPLRFTLRVLVYPKPLAYDLPISNEHFAPKDQGAAHKGEDDFYGLQTYQQGESIRRIHWKAFAKGHGLFSKQYGSSRKDEIWLDYVQVPGKDVEERLSLLCRRILDADQAGIRYGLRLPNQQLLPATGPQHRHRCLEALALYK